jgi:hypothetical protein
MEEGYYERITQFCSWFLLQRTTGFLIDEAWFQLTGYISAQDDWYWSSINPREDSEAPLSR